MQRTQADAATHGMGDEIKWLWQTKCARMVHGNGHIMLIVSEPHNIAHGVGVAGSIRKTLGHL